MEIVFLGTGAGMPAKQRNVTSIALKILSKGAIWLFDCGEGTQHQLLHTSLKPRKIEKIFITHLHGDHIFGLPGLLSSRSFLGGEEPLTVYGPPGIRSFIETSLSVSSTRLKYDLSVVEIGEGTVYEDDQFIVEAKRLDHAVLTFGYRIVEKDQPGTLLVDKLMALGIQPGPIYKRIKSEPTVRLDDGRVLNCSEFIGPPKKGRIVAILGDTRPCDNGVALAKDADLVIHEATFEKKAESLAAEYFHSTTRQAAEIAKKANAKALCLTHISSRYELKDNPLLEREAKEIFPNSTVAKDFKKILIPVKKDRH